MVISIYPTRNTENHREDEELQTLLTEDDKSTKSANTKATCSTAKCKPASNFEPPVSDKRKNGIFLYDSAPSYTEKPVRETLETLNLEILPHAAYSPNLVPSGYHLFSSMDHVTFEVSWSRRDATATSRLIGRCQEIAQRMV